jgi:uncharacterized protein (DUF2267 family)
MNFDQYVEKSNEFLKEVALELGIPEDTSRAYRVMDAVFHAIREVLSPEESLHLISQLPMFLKAVYVNGWHLNHKEKIKTMDEFLHFLRMQNLRTAREDFNDDNKTKEKVQAVIHVLKRHVTTGEIQDVIEQFPMELAGLWMTEAHEKI